MNTRELAARMGVTTKTVRLWCRRGLIPGACKESVWWEIPDDAEIKPVKKQGRYAFIPPPGYASVRQAAAQLCLTNQSIYLWIAKGRLRAERRDWGRNESVFVIPTEELERELETMEREREAFREKLCA